MTNLTESVTEGTQETYSLDEIINIITDTLAETDGEFITQIANNVLAGDFAYDGDSIVSATWGHINAELNPNAFIQDNTPLEAVSRESQESLPPAILGKQHNFKDWLDSVGYASQDERLEELHFEAKSEITSVRDALYTKFEMEAGYWDSDEFEKKAFDLFKEQYPNDVIYPKQYFTNDELKLQAKIAQTLKFISCGEISLTPDQVTNPDNPDQYEVMKLLFKIKTEKELSNFIRSATIDTEGFTQEGVGELLDQLNNTPTKGLRVSTQNTTKGM